MSPGQTSTRVYDLVKDQLMRGELRAGDRLDPARMAVALHASATPVRDALHQLFAERMVEAWPREGFKVPTPTETGLRDLYAWNGEVLATIMRSKWSRFVEPVTHAKMTHPIEGPRHLFAAIAAALGTGEHRHALDRASDRLQLARTIESSIFEDHAEELAGLVAAWTAARLPELREGLLRYHRRRRRHVGTIIATLLSPQ